MITFKFGSKSRQNAASQVQIETEIRNEGGGRGAQKLEKCDECCAGLWDL